MATTTKATHYAEPAPFPDGAAYGPDVIKVTGSSFGAAIGDIIRLRKAKFGETSLDAVLQTSDLDTGGSPAIVVSLELFNRDDSTVKTIIDGSTVGQTGGLARPTKAPATENGVFFTVPGRNWEYRLICDTAAATPVTNGVINVALSRTFRRYPGDVTE